jgi:hypothetical protein
MKERRIMNSIELLQFSLQNAFDIFGAVNADLTQEQADWQPPGIANPIGATYWHALSSIDHIVHRWCRGQEPLSETAGWREKALTVSVPEPEQDGDSLAYMRAIRVDLPSLHAYAQALLEAIQEWVASMSPEDLEQSVETPSGERPLGHLLETFVIWHINGHCGEIAALKGCQGAKGYPF